MTLEERLRKCLPYDQPVDGPLDRLMHEAADRIKASEAENAELRQRIAAFAGALNRIARRVLEEKP